MMMTRGAALLSLLAAAANAGDAERGKQIFAGKGGCVQCHSLQQRGGGLGPDLSTIAVTRTAESLRLALIDPGAEIYAEYFTAVVTTKGGERIEGIGLNQDDLSIQLRDRSGTPRSFLKRDLREWHREERSLMPPYGGRLAAEELDHVLAFLGTLRGAPATRRERTREIARVTETLAWMDRVERDGDERPETLLDALAIREGSVVADVGAGTGYFTQRLARRVGKQGKVFAVDVQQNMLDRIAALRLDNVELILGGERDPKLPEGGVDLILLANSFHEFADPDAMLAAFRRALKPGGRLVILEYAREDRSLPISAPHKMSRDEIRSEVEPAGFRLERILDFLPIQHGLVFSVIL